MSANTQEEFDKVLYKFAEGYGLTSVERAVIINGINKLKAHNTEPRTCETCAEYGRDDADCNGDRTGMECIDRSNWKAKPSRSPQSADVEMVRKYQRLLVSALEALYEAIQIAPLGRLPSKAVGVIQDIQAIIGDDAIAMHRIVRKEEK